MGYMVSFGRIRLWQVTLFCTVVFAAGLVIPTLTTAQSSSKEDTYRQLGLFGDIFQRVRESYVDEVEDSELIEAAITGMLTSLDPHSSFLNTENFSDMKEQTKGRFGGHISKDNLISWRDLKSTTSQNTKCAISFAARW